VVAEARHTMALLAQGESDASLLRCTGFAARRPMNTNFTAVPDWFPEENAGAGIAVADINGNGLADVVVFMVDDSPAQNAGYFRVGWGRDDQCTVGEWTTWTAVPDWTSWFNEGAGVAVADISGSGVQGSDRFPAGRLRHRRSADRFALEGIRSAGRGGASGKRQREGFRPETCRRCD
jgi:hypothetical protein